MKKKDIINLIKCYTEGNDSEFKNQSFLIAKDFENNGDYELANYIFALFDASETFETQGFNKNSKSNTIISNLDSGTYEYLTRVYIERSCFVLPDKIKNDILGIVNAISKNVGINKFLFVGSPGTGKTEAVKQIARISNKELYQTDFNQIIDSKLGQTSKNIDLLFNEMNNISHPERIIILFDEIDALALDRLNSNDIREMGRATSAILKALDNLNTKITLIATTNLQDYLDPALKRRFNKIINFNRYNREDLVDVATSILDDEIKKFPSSELDKKLFKKIINSFEKIPYPGDLKNLIVTSLAFSDSKSPWDYLKKIYESENETITKDNIDKLIKIGFTTREIEKLTGISKSTVSRSVRK